MSAPAPLQAERLHTDCDPAALGFESTAELSELDVAGIHSRAADAIRLGLDIRGAGYNLFVLGDPGSGRHDIVHRLLDEARGAGDPPADWCYVWNFADAAQPRLLRLPCGRGAGLRDDMQRFVEELVPAITAVFDSDEHRNRIEALQEEAKAHEENALRALGDDAQKLGVALLRTPHGFAFLPTKDEGSTLSQEEFEKLPEQRQKELGEHIRALHERLHRLMADFQRWRHELQGRLREAGREAIRATVTHRIDELKTRHADLPEACAQLDEVLADIVASGESLHATPRAEDDSETLTYTGSVSAQRYLVNLLVAHPADGTRPVVYEDHPTLQNLVGRIDHRMHLGTLVSNFTLIRAGALHRANGGFLVLDALKLLAQPFAWEGLKRALKSARLRIESLSELIGVAGSVQLEPQPMALDLKVVLIGERLTYYLLGQYDPEFGALFRINADMESEVERTPENTVAYARLIATLARRADLPPLAASAVARLIEHAARLAGDAERLATRTQPLDDRLREAAHLARAAGSARIERLHVDAALDAHRRRHERIRLHYQQEILRGQWLVDTAGSHVGQVNGLAVVPLGDDSFAHPVRITATVRVGEGEIVDIERVVKLGGPIHSKGVLILSAFVAARFGWTLPLSLKASLVLEQSYGGVEGDSAALAELAALLSALAGVPIHQALAVTGSVNQFGVVQPVGGINEKIEGFFDICVARGLTGEHGVLIPRPNVCHLMLRQDVVDAVRAGRFNVWAVADVDEALERLTGLPGGVPDAEGKMPEGSINARVIASLKRLAQLRRRFGDGKDDARSGDDSTPESNIR